MPRILAVARSKSALGPALQVLEDFGEVQISDSWELVSKELRARRPPNHLLVSSSALTDRAVATIQAARRKGYLVPTTVYVTPVPGRELIRVGQLKDLDATVVMNGDLHHLRGVLELSHADVALYLAEVVGAEPGFARSLIMFAERVPDDEPDPVGWLASALGVGRSALYEQARQAGLYRPSTYIAFFRLYDSVRLVHQGGSIDDAAFTAGMASPRSYRRSIRCHFNASISDIRQLETLDEIGILWREFQDIKERERRAKTRSAK